MSVYKFDCLIIGCGIAGLTAAIKVAEAGANVGIVTRANEPEESNTFWAQGGIIYTPEFDPLLEDDIAKASSYTHNKEASKLLAQRSGEILKEILLDKAQTNFVKKNEKLSFTKEAAHSKKRIIYKGDFTGKEIQISLLNYLNNRKRFPNVSLLTGHTAIDLITPTHHGVHLQQRYLKRKVVGAYILNQKTGEVIKAISKQTVLATGGIGSLYLHHSNSEGARGDGHAMAKRAGASLINMEFVQFHPTTFFDRSSHRRFLISEAMRGEGGILINSDGNEFMKSYHPDRELAPRDIVARAIAEEIIETRHECVYLDISGKNAKWIKSRFPTIYQHCLGYKLDITKEPIPVVPSAHYTCGGVRTDLNGKTDLEGLYAVGEVACTGLHGANRLASTSLLEGLTWGYIAAIDILENLEDEFFSEIEIKEWNLVHGEIDLALVQQDWLTLKQTMWNYVGLTRTSNRLARASAMFRELKDEIERFYKNVALHDSLIGLRNAVEVGHEVLQPLKETKSQ